MTGTGEPDFTDLSLLDLFRTEAENYTVILDTGLVEAEHDQRAEKIEPLMRAAHSIKGAARIVGLDPVVSLAHAMEDILSSAQQGKLALSSHHIDLLLKGNDILKHLASLDPEAIPGWLNENLGRIEELSRIIREPGDSPENPRPTEPPPSDPIIKPAASGPAVSDFADLSLLDLFRTEAENYTVILDTGLVEAEHDQRAEKIEPLMRAAHSIKGAARIVGLDPVVSLAHAMEDILSSAQQGKLALSSHHIDLLLKGNDILKQLASLDPEAIPGWLNENLGRIEELSRIIREGESSGPALSGEKPAPAVKTGPVPEPGPSPASDREATAPKEAPGAVSARGNGKGEATSVRVVSASLSRLMGLAGECLVQANLTKPFLSSLLRAKSMQMDLAHEVEELLRTAESADMERETGERVRALHTQLDQIRGLVSQQIETFDLFTRNLERLADRLYDEVLEIRMRPFSDGVPGFPRMVRDLAKDLGKKASLKVVGGSTRVDRDILEKLEAPLTHLLRNSVDHGLETPEKRLAAGKQPEGTVILEARHSSGMLHVKVSDDGGGVDLDRLREKIVRDGRVSAEMAAAMRHEELLDFLFLPGFSTAAKVTEVSGRGVGLDVVRSMVDEVGGTVSALSEQGKGSSFLLCLPLTLSVVRGLLVEIGGEPYAIPLARIDRIFEAPRDRLRILEDKQFITYEHEHLGIVDAHQALQAAPCLASPSDLRIAVISDRLNRYGLVVDKFIGERELVVIPLDPRLGKVPNVTAGAVLEDGSPVLILDIDDLVRSIDNILTQGRLHKVGDESIRPGLSKKRILVVDDSLTVREVERRLLENSGYDVVVAVDGVDGWNLLQGSGRFDLVISDIDMPRMNGIELIRKIKADARLKALPVIIVSYKDREEDRLRGLEAGANYYLTKSSFQDESLHHAVRDMIGEP